PGAVERGKVAEQLLPEPQLMVFLAVQPALTGPTQAGEPGGKGLSPVAGGVRAFHARLLAGQVNQAIDQSGLRHPLAYALGVIAQVGGAETQAIGPAQGLGELVAQTVVGVIITPKRRVNQCAERLQLPALVAEAQQCQGTVDQRG